MTAEITVGTRIRYAADGDVVVVRERKDTDDGWWVDGDDGHPRGGLADSVIADGTWVVEPQRERERVTQLDVDEIRRLDHWCRSLKQMVPDAIGTYLVGSALTRPDYRDVDIRVVLDDDVHHAIPASVNPLDLNMLLSGWGRQVTGLRIDCQIQSMEECQALVGPKHPQGLRP